MSVISELATCCPSHGWRLVRALVYTEGARIWFPFAPSLSTDSSHLCPPSLLKVATNGTKRNAVRLCATTSVAICNSPRKKSRKSRIKAYWKAGYLQLAMHTIIKNVYRCWFVSPSPPLVGISLPPGSFFSTASCLLLFQFNYQGNVLKKVHQSNDRVTWFIASTDVETIFEYFLFFRSI